MLGSAVSSEKDFHTLLGIVADDRVDLPAEGLPPSLLSEMTDLIRCDAVSFVGRDSSRQMNWFAQDIPSEDDLDDADLDAAFWSNYWDCEPCSYADRTGDLRSVTMIPDFYSVRQWHATGMYGDYFRPLGLDHELNLCLPEAPGLAPGPGRTVRLTFFRGPGRDFAERDRALLVLLRPHLYQAYLNAERRRHGELRLTRRHWELLQLVAAGLTNDQIARRLDLSEGTVRKHLENIYGRLHVSSRTAAVTRAFPDRAAV
jgi:DNA-binding CsgD family transcriptional regulator